MCMIKIGILIANRMQSYSVYHILSALLTMIIDLATGYVRVIKSQAPVRDRISQFIPRFDILLFYLQKSAPFPVMQDILWLKTMR